MRCRVIVRTRETEVRIDFLPAQFKVQSDPSFCFLMASTPAARQAAYRALVHEQVEEKSLDDLRQHTQQQRAWGSERFQQQIEALTQRSASIRPRGRPAKAPKTLD